MDVGNISGTLANINVMELLGTIGPFVIAFFFILGVAGIAFTAWFFGLLTPRPYKALVLAMRGNGFKPFMEKGRNLPSGMFGIWSGPMTKEVKVQSPKEDMITEGAVCFVRRAVDDYIPCMMRMGKPNEMYDTGEKDEYGQPIMRPIATVLLDPCMNPAAKLAFSNQTIEDARRFHRPGFVEKYGLILVCIVMAVILGGSSLVGSGMVANSNFKCSANSDVIAQKLQGASQVVINIPANTTNTAKIPGLPTVPGG